MQRHGGSTSWVPTVRMAVGLFLVLPVSLLLPAAGLGQAPTGLPATDRDLVAGARQHLLVVTEAPGDIRGQLFRVEWMENEWRRSGTPIPVVVGRSGIGPKREGDGRSPQGVFELGRVFGYASTPPPGLSLSYEAQAPGAVCVDDVASEHYNRVFDADTLSIPRDWSSAEAMRRDLAHGDDLYRWGIMVRYNADGEPGAGSCIFLHVWRDPESPTAGCTAMAEGDLLDLLRWLEPGGDRTGPERRRVEGQEEVPPGSGPVLIQGSRGYLEGLRNEGILPYPVPVQEPMPPAGIRRAR